MRSDLERGACDKRPLPGVASAQPLTEKVTGFLWLPKAVTLLIGALAVCFALQLIVVRYYEKPYDAYVALSGYGMKSGHLWELWTWLLLSGGFIHFFLNLAGCYWVARPLEAAIGTRAFLWLFFGSAFAGSVLQGAFALAGFVIPESMESLASVFRDRFGGPFFGSSVGLLGILPAYCAANRAQGIRVFSRLRMPEAVPWIAALLVCVAMLILSSSPSIPHLGHIGAILAGIPLSRVARSIPTPTV